MQEPIEVHEERVAASAGPPVAATSVVPTGAVASVGAPTGVYASRTSVVPSGYRASQIVWFIISALNIILAFDFFFRLLKAADQGFGSLVYGIGGVLGAPFDPVFGYKGSNPLTTLRWADLLAMLVYSLLGWMIVKAIRISATRERGPVV